MTCGIGTAEEEEYVVVVNDAPASTGLIVSEAITEFATVTNTDPTCDVTVPPASICCLFPFV